MRLTKEMMRAEGQKVYDKFGMKAKLDFLAGAEWAMEHYEKSTQNLPKADAYSLLGDGWRDARKELPKNSYDVIICDDEGFIYIGFYSSEGWIRDCGEDLINIIAWMPLSVIGKPAFA